VPERCEGHEAAPREVFVSEANEGLSELALTVDE